MEIIYKAKDGKIFDSKRECENYENTLECSRVASSLFWWNNKREPIPVSIDADSLYYFYIKSEDALEFMEEVFRDYGWSAYDDLKVGGMYYWNDMAESFYNTGEQIDRLNDEINELQNIRRFMWDRGQE
jgi:hypothetical protein